MKRLFKPASEAELSNRPRLLKEPEPRHIGRFRSRAVVHDPFRGGNEVMFGYKGGMSIDGSFPSRGVMEEILLGDYTFLVVGTNVMNLLTQMGEFRV